MDLPDRANDHETEHVHVIPMNIDVLFEKLQSPGDRIDMAK